MCKKCSSSTSYKVVAISNRSTRGLRMAPLIFGKWGRSLCGSRCTIACAPSCFACIQQQQHAFKHSINKQEAPFFLQQSKAYREPSISKNFRLRGCCCPLLSSHLMQQPTPSSFFFLLLFPYLRIFSNSISVYCGTQSRRTFSGQVPREVTFKYMHSVLKPKGCWWGRQDIRKWACEWPEMQRCEACCARQEVERTCCRTRGQQMAVEARIADPEHITHVLGKYRAI